MIAGKLYSSNIWPVNIDLKTLNGTNGFTITGLGYYGFTKMMMSTVQNTYCDQAYQITVLFTKFTSENLRFYKKRFDRGFAEYKVILRCHLYWRPQEMINKSSLDTES